MLTVLHAGGKFDKKSYTVSGGLHGVGVTCVNALSETLEVEVKRDGKVHHMRFKRGITASKLEVIGKAKGTGTKITFMADNEIFPVIEYKYDILANRLRELAFLNRGIEITLKDERHNKEELFKFNGGIEEFIRHINRAKEPLHPKVIYVEKEKDGITAEVALQYNKTSKHILVNGLDSQSLAADPATTGADFRAHPRRTGRASVRRCAMELKHQLIPALRHLRLSGILDTLDVRTQQAIAEQWSYIEFLARLLEDEVERRAQKQLTLRIRGATLNTGKTLEDFDFKFNPTINRQAVLQLATCDYIRQKRNALLCGPAGVGKTHLAQALAHEACRQGFDVLFTDTHKMLRHINGGRSFFCLTNSNRNAW